MKHPGEILLGVVLSVLSFACVIAAIVAIVHAQVWWSLVLAGAAVACFELAATVHELPS